MPGKGIKPWYAARWETVEPEEDLASPVIEYNDPSDNELLDYEDMKYIFNYKYENWHERV